MSVVPAKWIAGLSGANAALRSIRSERSMTSVVLLARLVQRLASEAIETDLGGPWQHQRAAAAVAIDAFERQAFQHRLSAAGADRLGGERVRVLHHGVLRRIGTQHLFLGGIGARLAYRLEPERLGLLQHDAHLGDRDLLGRK